MLVGETWFVRNIYMLEVPAYTGSGVLEVSRTPITNRQYAPPIEALIDQGTSYMEVMRGMNKRVAVNPLSETDVRDSYGKSRLNAATSGDIVRVGRHVFLFKLDPRPSPDGFDGVNRPVVNVAPIQAEAWCEIVGQGLRLLTRKEMTHVLTGGGRLKYPTTGELFDANGNRLLHGSLELRDGKVVEARVRERSTCDVDETNSDGSLRYPDGPFGTRIAQAGVMLIAADDLFFGASWCNYLPVYFKSSVCYHYSHDLRGDDAGFAVGRSSKDSR